jgi:hypothetical protein
MPLRDLRRKIDCPEGDLRSVHCDQDPLHCDCSFPTDDGAGRYLEAPLHS